MEARLKAGISQQKLGEMAKIDVGVAGVRINRYERGVHSPDLKIAEQLAAALKVPAPYLFASDDVLAELILATHGLNKAELERVAKYTALLKKRRN